MLGKSLRKQMIFGLLSVVILICLCGFIRSSTTQQNGDHKIVVGITFGNISRMSWVVSNKKYLERNGYVVLIVTGMRMRHPEIMSLDCPVFDEVVHDGVSSTTCLVHNLIGYAAKHGSSLFRIGDDSFLNVSNFRTVGLENSYVGSLLTIDPNKFHPGYNRWLLITGLPCFPTYAAGAGYFLGFEAVRKLSKIEPRLIMNEDVVMGLWVSMLNITRVHEPRIKAYRPHLESNILSHYIQEDSEFKNMIHYIN